MFIKIMHNYFRNLKTNREKYLGQKSKAIFIISKIILLFIFYFLSEFSM